MFSLNENSKKLKHIKALTDQVNYFEPQMSSLTDIEVKQLTAEFKKNVENGVLLDDLLPKAYALVREATKRVHNMRHYDVQIMGAIALHYGYISEMATGEGKTIVAALPSYLNALSGEGVHVVTVNSYLAERDHADIGKIHDYLGLSTGLVSPALPPMSQERRAEYSKDITYGTTSEFGFDYLRDNMVTSPGEKVQRGHAYALIDEADSILIDEARVPMIIANPSSAGDDMYRKYSDLVASFDIDTDVHVHKDKKTVHVSDLGAQKVESTFGVANLYDGTNPQHVHHLSVALYAQYILENGVDYIVTDDRVDIVDEFTGRVLQGRRWGDGRHQAVEAKEKVTVQEESLTMASISIQAYYKMYAKIAGMTGTAASAAAELMSVYGLPVVSIPPNKPSLRKDAPDVIYATYDQKIRAVCNLVKTRRELGQPVLIGTSSVEESEKVSEVLRSMGQKHKVLNARDHANEAATIASAGRWGEVTVSTNMAGRGVDIILGGNAGIMAKDTYEYWLANTDTSSLSTDVLLDVRSQISKQHASLCAADALEIAALGGLLVIGTSRNNSERVDQQLRGRAGRQGDPGETQFHVSMQDTLMQVYAKSAIGAVLAKNANKEVIQSALAAKVVTKAQLAAEGLSTRARAELVKYDDVYVLQQTEVYRLRDAVLDGTYEYMRETTESYLSEVCSSMYESSLDEYNCLDFETLSNEFKEIFKIPLSSIDFVDEHGDALSSDSEKRHLPAFDLAKSVLSLDALDIPTRLTLMRSTYLTTLDTLWRPHVDNLKNIQEGIHLRSLGQKNPLTEWQQEAFDMFTLLSSDLKTEYIINLVNAAESFKKSQDTFTLAN